jgi:hypothetical protein
VVIDTLAKLWPKAGSRSEGKTLYHHDYDFISQIKKIANLRNIAILAIHHLRKSGSDDPIEQLSGSMGISGSADTVHILQRARGAYSATLCITGRDVEEKQLALEFEKSRTMWRLLGNADEVAKTKERQDILDVLRDAPPEGMRPTEVAKILKRPDANVRRLLIKLLREGQVLTKGYGIYILNISHTDHSGSEDHISHTVHTPVETVPLATSVIVH